MVRNYIDRIQEAIVQRWDLPAYSDYHKETFSNADVAKGIGTLHILFRAAGIERGDRIALAGKNCSNWATAFLATVTCHAVAVPILNDFTPDNILNLARHSESKLLFTEKRTFQKMAPEQFDGIKAVINIENFEALYTCDEAVAEAVRNAESAFCAAYPDGLKPSDINYGEGSLDELSIINYTSGTTGNPKGIMLTARAISSNIQYALDNFPIKDGDQAVSMLPLAHMYGLAFEFIYKFCGGAHIHFLGKTPSPSILLMAFAEVRPYQVITVPLVIEKIIKTKVIPTLEKGAMKALTRIPGISSIIYAAARRKVMNAFGGKVRELIIGGAAISAPVESVLRKLRIPYTVGYGMTECAPIVGYATWQSFVKGSCGRIVDRMQIRIDSDDPRRTVGEIQLKGDNVMSGYYRNEEATAAAFTEDGWLRTGDLGIVDKNGNIFIKGRSKCMILSANGQNIYPEEIESKLNSMEHIGESIVVARDKNLVAIVSLSPDKDKLLAEGIDVDELLENTRRELNRTLPLYSQIARIELVEGEFVHTPKHSIKRILYK